jgi:hypothetical protein
MEEARATTGRASDEISHKEKDMIRGVLALVPAVLFAGVAGAQQYPLMNTIADRVVQRYREATCEQLWERKGKPKGDEEQKVTQLMREDPQMRTAFIDKIAAPIANKMFECGMIP